MPRHVTTAEFEALLSAGLTDRQFKRAVYSIEHGADALRLRDLQVRLDVTAKLYGEALNAAQLRLRDGSLHPYQLRSLTWAFQQWRAAVEALVDHQSSRRVPAAAE